MTLAKVKTAVALLNSMVLSGEDHSDTSRKIVDEALAMLEAAPAPQCVEVKPLEWETVNNSMYWVHTQFGRYAVWEVDGEGYADLADGSAGRRAGSSLQSAKEAVTSDIKKKGEKLFTTRSVAGVRNEALREALAVCVETKEAAVRAFPQMAIGSARCAEEIRAIITEEK